jgi:hypothetical protein
MLRSKWRAKQTRTRALDAERASDAGKWLPIQGFFHMGWKNFSRTSRLW